MSRARIDPHWAACGYTIERAADGEAGLARPSQGRADVLVVERMLPLLDGLTVLIRLRQGGICTSAIVLSALAGVNERIGGLRAVGDDYLVKPFALARCISIWSSAQPGAVRERSRCCRGSSCCWNT